MTLHKDVMLDFARDARTGLDEAVFCAGKTAAHVAEILRQVEARAGRILLTRLHPDQFAALPEAWQNSVDYDALSQTGYFSQPHPQSETKQVAVVAAGTSDVAVAREAARTLARRMADTCHIRGIAAHVRRRTYLFHGCRHGHHLAQRRRTRDAGGYCRYGLALCRLKRN